MEAPPEETEKVEERAVEEKVEEVVEQPYAEVKPIVEEDLIEPLIEEYMAKRGLGDRTKAALRIGRTLSKIFNSEDGMDDLKKAVYNLKNLPDMPILKEVKETLAARAAQKAIKSTFDENSEERAVKITEKMLERMAPYFLAIRLIDRFSSSMSRSEDKTTTITEERIREMIRDELQPLYEMLEKKSTTNIQTLESEPLNVYEKAFKFAKEIIEIVKPPQPQESRSTLEQKVMDALAERLAKQISEGELSEDKLKDIAKKTIEEMGFKPSNLPPEIWRDIKLKEIEFRKFLEEQRFEREKLERQERIEKEKTARLERLLGPAIARIAKEFFSPEVKQGIKEWVESKQAKIYRFICPYCNYDTTVKLTNQDIQRIASEGYVCPKCGKLITSTQSSQTSSTSSMKTSQAPSQKSKESPSSKKPSKTKTTTSSTTQSNKMKNSSEKS